MELKPGYKQTEVGVIPLDWEVRSLAEITDTQRPISYGIVQTGPGVPNGVQCIRVVDIQDGRINQSDLITTSKQISDAYQRTILKVNDLVMPLRGKVGDIGLVDKELDGANLTRGVALIAIRAAWSPVFCQQVISSATTRRRLEQAMNGSALQEIPIASLRVFKIPIPKELSEQCAIAEALSDVDGLLGGLDRLISKKRDLKQATMQQLLTGQTRLPGFSGEWGVRRIDELEKMKLVRLSRGQVISKKDIDKTPGDFPIYSSSVHNDGLFGRYGEFMFDEELITWSVDGGGNFFYRPRHKFSVTNVCGFMRVDNTRIDCRFLAAQLQFLHARKSFDYQSKAHPSVVRKEYEVRLSSLPEQTAIAAVLSDMEAELAALEARRDKTRALKQAMMQELLTGRTRLV